MKRANAAGDLQAWKLGLSSSASSVPCEQVPASTNSLGKDYTASPRPMLVP